MSDQILLTMAAKAAGIGPVLCYVSERNHLRVGTRESYTVWRPLTNGDDALRLAAALKMNIDYGSGTVYAQHRTADGFWINSPPIPTEGRDMAEVYREAICACAALIGERMP